MRQKSLPPENRPFYEQFEPDVAGELADRCPKMAARSRIRQTGTMPQPKALGALDEVLTTGTSD